MELFDLIAVLASLGMVLAGVFGGIMMIKKGEKGKRTAQDSISSMYSTYNQQVKDVIAIKDSQLKRLQNKIQQLEPDIDQTESNTPIDLGSLEKLAQERGINPALLKSPIIQKMIKKYTKGMGIEEIIALAEQFGLLKGNKKSQSEVTPLKEDYTGFF